MSTDALPAITVRQPWAWAIAHAGKTPENRGRTTNYRGPIAIHAGLKWSDVGEYDERIEEAFGPFLTDQQAARPYGRIDPAEHRERLFFGAVIAVAELVDCHEVRMVDGPGWCCRPWGELWHYGTKGLRCPAHHLVLANVRALSKPVPCAGALRVAWTLPADVAAEVQRQLADLPIGASHV